MFPSFSTIMTKARVALLVSGMGVAVALAVSTPSSAYARPISHRCDQMVWVHNYWQSVMLDRYSSLHDSLIAARNDNALIARARAAGCSGI
jgi:hypothetical protein